MEIERPPTLSVLMTAYNRQDFIEEAISSVLESTFTDWELIIVDDCSTDNTVQIATGFTTKDARIKLFRNEINLGDYPNRNKAASYATGKYLMYVDSDDKIYKDGFKNCVSQMTLYPECKFGMFFKDISRKTFLLESRDSLQMHFFEDPILMMGPGGTIIDREFFHHIGKYPELYGPANDMYFNLKAASRSSVLFLPFEFLYYRRHAGQEINNQYNYLANGYRYMRDALAELELPFSSQQINRLTKKNKRRFAVNLCKFFFKTFDITKTKFAIRSAGFSSVDFFQGIFHI